MTQRFWRDLLAAGKHGLWQGAIPVTAKENFFFDVVMRLAKKEENREKLGELLAEAAHEGRVPVKPPSAPAGRPSKKRSDLEVLREIRAQNPESDGWVEFRDRLTQKPDRARRVSKGSARRRYLECKAALDLSERAVRADADAPPEKRRK